VEENEHHAKALAYFLEKFDMNLEILNEIGTAIEALKTDHVDCVILDMGIPDRQAYDTLEAVKKTPGLEHLPIIIFTGKSLSQPEVMKIRQYADSIVVKTAYSYKRILDEVSLFLHLMERGKNEPQAPKYHKLGALDEVLKNKTVLVADDDMRNIFSLTKALEKYQMTVIAAVDGKDALKKLQASQKVDIVLMDMMMPEMDGYETTAAIRKDRKYKDVPIIAVTAKAMVGDREKCIDAGASDYITKPVDVDQLFSLLRVWLYESGRK
jgi:CheY-like chemotaxis protein